MITFKQYIERCVRVCRERAKEHSESRSHPAFKHLASNELWHWMNEANACADAIADLKPSSVEKAKEAFFEAALAMMNAKRKESAEADFDDKLGLAVLQTTRAAHRAHYDLLNALAIEESDEMNRGGADEDACEEDEG